MVNYIKKDVTTVTDGLILQGCNCSGGYGSGVAGAIRKKWPETYTKFKQNGTGKQLLGTTDFIILETEQNVIVANGYTQEKFGNDGKRYASITAVESCIVAAVEYAAVHNLPLYMPMVGCGLGGLSWDDEVKPIVEKVSLKFSNINIFVCDL